MTNQADLTIKVRMQVEIEGALLEHFTKLPSVQEKLAVAGALRYLAAKGLAEAGEYDIWAGPFKIVAETVSTQSLSHKGVG